MMTMTMVLLLVMRTTTIMTMTTAKDDDHHAAHVADIRDDTDRVGDIIVDVDSVDSTMMMPVRMMLVMLGR